MKSDLKKCIEDLQEKHDRLSSMFKAGKISPRYNQHLGLILQYFKITINHLERVYESKTPPLSNEFLEKVSKRYIEPLLLIYYLFSNKIGKEVQEDDKALESIAMDFFRMSTLAGIDTMVLIEESGFKPKARVEPIGIYLKDKTIGVPKNAPIIVVNEKFVEDIGNWILILHETSHLVSMFEECLQTENPRLKYECELFSDLYSTHIAGYAYVNALIRYAKNNGENIFIFTQTHPSMVFRVRITLDYLKRKFTMVIGEGVMNKLEMDWISWLESTGYRVPVGFNDEFRAEFYALKMLDKIIEERNVSNNYDELIERIKAIEDDLYLQLTPIELLNYILLSKDFSKPVIDEEKAKNLIIKWSKERYGG